MPPSRSMSAIFAWLVVRAITATNGSPSMRAKYASDTAVEPLDASVTVVPGPMSPLQMA